MKRAISVVAVLALGLAYASAGEKLRFRKELKVSCGSIEARVKLASKNEKALDAARRSIEGFLAHTAGNLALPPGADVKAFELTDRVLNEVTRAIVGLMDRVGNVELVPGLRYLEYEEKFQPIYIFDADIQQKPAPPDKKCVEPDLLENGAKWIELKKKAANTDLAPLVEALERDTDALIEQLICEKEKGLEAEAGQLPLMREIVVLKAKLAQCEKGKPRSDIIRH